jgi:mannitol dehydrogenase domain protein
VNLPAYRDKVLERFGNDAIRDTNQRVTADSFSKIPGFILPTIRDRLKQDQSIDAVAMLPAMFLVFLTRWHEGKLPFEYHDQSMDPRATHTIVEADDPVKALVADRLLWQELAGDRRLEEAVRKALVRVQKEVLPQG